MVRVRIFMAIPIIRLVEAIEVLKIRRWTACQWAGPRFLIGSREVVICVAVDQVSTRFAARGVHLDVALLLRDGGIPSRLLAVDCAAPPRDERRAWHVLSDPRSVGKVRGALANLFRVERDGGGAKWLGPLLLGTATLVAGNNKKEAEENWLALRASRGDPEGPDSHWLLEKLSTKHGGGPISGPGNRPQQMGSWLLLSVPLWALSIWGVGAQNGVLLASLVCILLAAAMRWQWPRPGSEGRLTACLRLLLLGFMSSFLALGVLHPAIQDFLIIRQAALVSIFAAMAVGTWLLLPWREADKVIAWVAPLVFAGAAALTPLLGRLMYMAYLEKLLVPYDAVTFSTWENAAAGIMVLGLWTIYTITVLGFFGLYGWMFGRAVVPQASMLVLVALAAFLLTLTDVLGEAQAAAGKVSTDGVPKAWFAIDPKRVCISAPAPGTATYGEIIDYSRPQALLGSNDGRWAVWSEGAPKSESPRFLQIPVDSVSVTPAKPGQRAC